MNNEDVSKAQPDSAPTARGEGTASRSSASAPRTGSLASTGTSQSHSQSHPSHPQQQHHQPFIGDISPIQVRQGNARGEPRSLDGTPSSSPLFSRSPQLSRQPLTAATAVAAAAPSTTDISTTETSESHVMPEPFVYPSMGMSPFTPYHDAPRADSRPVEEAPGDGEWASPEELLQMRALTHNLIERYQTEITKLSTALRHTQAERDQYLQDIHATRHLKAAYAEGKKLSEASRLERQRTAEEQETLRLQMQKLLIDNEKLKLALLKQKQKEQEAQARAAQRASESAVAAVARAHARDQASGGRNERLAAPNRKGCRVGSSPHDEMTSPSATAMTTSPTTVRLTDDSDTPGRKRDSHSMPSAVDQYYRYLDLVAQQKQAQQRQQDREANQDDDDNSEGTAEEVYRHRPPTALSATRHPTRGGADMPIVPRSSSSLETPTLNDDNTEKGTTTEDERLGHAAEDAQVSRSDDVPVEARDAGKAARLRRAPEGHTLNDTQPPIPSATSGTATGSSSIETPSPSDTTLSRPEPVVDVHRKITPGKNRTASSGREEGTSASSHPEYARGASATTSTSAVTPDTDERVSLPFSQPEMTRMHRAPQGAQPPPLADQTLRSPSSLAPSSALSKSSTATSSIPFLYTVPRTPADALASEAKLLASIKALKEENEAYQARLALLENLLRNQQSQSGTKAALQAHESERVKRQCRELQAQLATAEAEVTRWQAGCEEARVEEAALTEMLRVKEAALRDAREGETERTRSALAEAAAQHRRELADVKASTAKALAEVEAEKANLARQLATQKNSFDAELKKSVANAQAVEKELAEERRRHRTVAEALRAAEQLAASEKHNLRHELTEAAARLAHAEEQLDEARAVREALEAQVARLLEEAHTQEAAAQQAHQQLTDACHALTELQDTKEVLAMVQLQANADAEEKTSLSQQLEAQQRVMESALSSLQAEHAAEATALASQLEKITCKYEALKLKLALLLKKDPSLLAEVASAPVPRRKTKRQEGSDGVKLESATSVVEGPGPSTQRDPGSGGEVLDAREVLRASTEAVARLGHSIRREP